jgi:hypothetical protein
MGFVIDLSKGKNGGGISGTGWGGQVEFRANLPITLGSPAIGDVWLVEKPTTIGLGLLSYTTYQSGLYLKESDTGSLSDWRRLNVKVQFTDGEFAVVSALDTSIKSRFDLTLLSQSRVYNFQDKNGTIALLDDIPTPGIPEAPADGALYLRNGNSQAWNKLYGVSETFPISAKEGNQDATGGQFQCSFIILPPGTYNTFAIQLTEIDLNGLESYQLRACVYDLSETLITQGNLLLDSSSVNESVSFPSDAEINISTPTGVYLGCGINNQVGNGDVQIVRINANQLNDVNASFQFIQVAGQLPATLPARTATNNVRHTVFYGA